MKDNNHNKSDVLNPFVPQHPAQSQYFAGRKAELEQFRKAAFNSAKLDPPTPTNFALLGSWGMGKTSLLYEFKQVALQELQDQISCASFFFALSPQSCRTWDDFTGYFLRRVRSTMAATEGIRTKVLEEKKSWDLEFNLGPVSGHRQRQKVPPDLEEALESLWLKHLKPKGAELALVLLDDLHYFPITPDDSSYLNLRTTFQELVHRGCNYSLLVTAPTGLLAEIAESAEPMIRFFTQFNLTPFTLAEANEAVQKRLAATRQGIRVEESVISEIVQRTAGHPYFVMYVMYELMSKLDGTREVSSRLFERSWPAIRESLFQSVFDQKFKSASPKERELMVRIAKYGEDVISSRDVSEVKGANVLLSRLEEKELLIRRERGRYSLFHPLFAEFLRGE